MLFIVLVFFLVLAVGDFSLLRTQFRPFTGVLGRIWWFVTRKVGFATLNRLRVKALKRRNRGLTNVTNRDCRGSRVGCSASDAGGTTATSDFISEQGKRRYFRSGGIHAQAIP